LRKDLEVTLHASKIIASEQLVEFDDILLGEFVALGNSTSFVKKIDEIKWWHVFTHEFVLYIFSNLNRCLKLSFPVSFHICSVLARLSSQFRDSETDFLHFRERVSGEIPVHIV